MNPLRVFAIVCTALGLVLVVLASTLPVGETKWDFERKEAALRAEARRNRVEHKARAIIEAEDLKRAAQEESMWPADQRESDNILLRPMRYHAHAFFVDGEKDVNFKLIVKEYPLRGSDPGERIVFYLVAEENLPKEWQTNGPSNSILDVKFGQIGLSQDTRLLYHKERLTTGKYYLIASNFSDTQVLVEYALVQSEW